MALANSFSGLSHVWFVNGEMIMIEALTLKFRKMDSWFEQKK